jgi:hypothetical protein
VFREKTAARSGSLASMTDIFDLYLRWFYDDEEFCFLSSNYLDMKLD